MTHLFTVKSGNGPWFTLCPTRSWHRISQSTTWGWALCSKRTHLDFLCAVHTCTQSVSWHFPVHFICNMCESPAWIEDVRRWCIFQNNWMPVEWRFITSIKTSIKTASDSSHPTDTPTKPISFGHCLLEPISRINIKIAYDLSSKNCGRETSELRNYWKRVSTYAEMTGCVKVTFVSVLGVASVGWIPHCNGCVKSK